MFWNALVAASLTNCHLFPNHAFAGAKIVPDMDGQTVAAAGDNADIIFIQLGTNDGVGAVQAEYQENLVELMGTNPGADIYALGVFPKDPPGGRAVINAQIEAAALAAGVPYWDTDGWIDPTPGVDTIDGLHPNESGHAKIAVEVLARL